MPQVGAGDDLFGGAHRPERADLAPAGPDARRKGVVDHAGADGKEEQQDGPCGYKQAVGYLAAFPGHGHV